MVVGEISPEFVGYLRRVLPTLFEDYAFALSVLYSRHTATFLFFFLAVAGRARRRGGKKS